MNEIVKYHNDLSNQIVIKTLNANELNFFMAICAKMRNQETNEILFTFEQLKKLTSWRSNDNKDFIKSLENTNKKLRSEEHTSELQSRQYLVCRLLLEKKKTNYSN